MKTRRILSGGCLVAFLTLPALAFAQAGSEDVPDAKLHLGPLGLSPSLTISNVGIDTNVFNTPDNQTRDFTIGLLPSTGESLPVGRLLLTGTTGVPLTYFQKAVTQRSVGFQQTGRADLNLIHFRPYVTVAYGSTYNRPNDEIDTRVQQVATAQGFGTIVRVGARTSLDLGYVHSMATFGSGADLGVDLAQQLDRRASSFNGTLRMSLTSLTTLVIRSSLERDRFATNTLLNNNSVTVLPGLELKRDARLSGNVYVGIRALRPLSPLVPNFTGVVGSAALGFLVRDRTKVDGRFNRNVEYSIDDTTPYFVTTAASVAVTQLLVGHVDAVVGYGKDLLAYRDQLNAGTIAPLGRTDRTTSTTFGSGYRFRIDARIGFTMAYQQRLSGLDGRRYSGFQFGGTVNYGF